MEFTDRIQAFYKLPDEDAELLLQNMEECFYPAKKIILREGERDDYAYFVKEGFVRGYVLREGRCITLLFAFEGSLAATTPGLSNRRGAKFTLEAVEDSVLLRISRERMEALFSESVELANWGRKIAEKSLFEYEHYFADYYWADKKEQYLILMKEYPELFRRVSLKELASYLNLTPQSLSRIRASIK